MRTRDKKEDEEKKLEEPVCEEMHRVVAENACSEGTTAEREAPAARILKSDVLSAARSKRRVINFS